VACYLAISVVGTVVLNIGTVTTWLIGIALVLGPGGDLVRPLPPHPIHLVVITV
jgi:hypothetical protein